MLGAQGHRYPESVRPHGFMVEQEMCTGPNLNGVYFAVLAGHITNTRILYSDLIPRLRQIGDVLVATHPTDGTFDEHSMAEQFVNTIPRNCRRLVLIGESMGANFWLYVVEALARARRSDIIRGEGSGVIAEDAPTRRSVNGLVRMGWLWRWPRWINPWVDRLIYRFQLPEFEVEDGVEPALSGHRAHVFGIPNRVRRAEMGFISRQPSRMRPGEYADINLLYIAGPLDPFVKKLPATREWGEAFGMISPDAPPLTWRDVNNLEWVVSDPAAGHGTWREQPRLRLEMMTAALGRLGYQLGAD